MSDDATPGNVPLSDLLGAWQPIETAPHDGTYVIVWPPTWTGVTSCARWNDMGRITVSRDNPPTHWTLLAPPVSA
jgi:hypothetical protein